MPVVCCGNVTVGGAGKTTLVLDLAHRLSGRGVHILLRGYGGSARGVHRVEPDDPASLVGDEALLLAEVAPTWTGADRAASARGRRSGRRENPADGRWSAKSDAGENRLDAGDRRPHRVRQWSRAARRPAARAGGDRRCPLPGGGADRAGHDTSDHPFAA